MPPKSVLGRALTLLTAFRPGDAELTLAELARRTGLPKPTAHRMLAELAEWNVVERTPHGHPAGDAAVRARASSRPLQLGLREAAAPFLSDLFEATHETVHLAVPDGLDVVYVQKLPGRHGPRISSRIGGRMPAYCTGVGKAMLAFAPPERLAAVVAAGLARRTPRTVVAPGLLAEELARIRERGVAGSTRSRRSGSRPSRPRCATAARTPSRRSRSPGGPTGSTPPASRPPSARPRSVVARPACRRLTRAGA